MREKHYHTPTNAIIPQQMRPTNAKASTAPMLVVTNIHSICRVNMKASKIARRMARGTANRHIACTYVQDRYQQFLQHIHDGLAGISQVAVILVGVDPVIA